MTFTDGPPALGRRLRRMTALALLRDGVLALLAATLITFFGIAVRNGESDTAIADVAALMVVAWLWLGAHVKTEE